MHLVAQKLAKEEGVDESGYRLTINTGPDGGQVVYHIHLHLMGGRSFHTRTE
jgi:histidine triad (HIT) family protein